jgi:hypothetical protein
MKEFGPVKVFFCGIVFELLFTPGKFYKLLERDAVLITYTFILELIVEFAPSVS